MSEREPVLQVRGLRVDAAAGALDIVDDIDFDLERGKILGLVGESGCGKTAVAMALLGHTRVGTRIAGGSIMLGGMDLAQSSRHLVRQMRGNRISYVPQDPSKN